jgi:multiple sugar transport system permease protein
MSDSAATLTQDRQKLEMAALSAPAVIFTVAMIAFPVVYTIWLGSRRFPRPASSPLQGLPIIPS